MLVLLAVLLVVLLTYTFWTRAKWLLVLLVTTLPLERIGGFDLQLLGNAVTVRPSQLVGLSLLIILFGHRETFKLRRFEWLPVAYLGAGLLSLFGAVSPLRGGLVLAFTLFVWLLFLGVARLARTVDLALLERALWWTTLLAVLFGFYQFAGDLLGFGWTGLREDYTKAIFGFPRIQSFALEPLYLANFLLIPFALFLSLLVKRRDWRSILIVFLLALTLTLTLSRGGYAAGIVVLIVVLAGLWQARRALILLGAGTVGAGVLAGILLIGGASLEEAGNFSNVQEFSAQATNFELSEVSLGGGDNSPPPATSRGYSRTMAWQAFQESPLTGVGLGNFGRWAQSRDSTHFSEASIVNNEPLELLAETGILGFAAVTAFVLAILRRSLQAFRSGVGTEQEQAWLVGLTAAVVGFAVQYQTFSTLYITHIWVALGLLVAVQDRMLSSSNRKKAAP